MNKHLREQAMRLRLQEELSYSEIKKRLGVPKSTLSYWLRDHPLSDEKVLELHRKGWTKGETAREKYRITRQKQADAKLRAFYTQEMKAMKKISSRSFYIAGLMLYLGEGAKKKRGQLVMTNTDPFILNFFIE